MGRSYRLHSPPPRLSQQNRRIYLIPIFSLFLSWQFLPPLRLSPRLNFKWRKTLSSKGRGVLSFTEERVLLHLERTHLLPREKIVLMRNSCSRARILHCHNLLITSSRLSVNINPRTRNSCSSSSSSLSTHSWTLQNTKSKWRWTTLTWSRWVSSTKLCMYWPSVQVRNSSSNSSLLPRRQASQLVVFEAVKSRRYSRSFWTWSHRHLVDERYLNRISLWVSSTSS